MSSAQGARYPRASAPPPVRPALSDRDGAVAGFARTPIRAIRAVLTAGSRPTSLLPVRRPTAQLRPVRHDVTDDRNCSAGDEAVSVEELTILTLLAEGLPLDSVAARTGMSPRTLRRRVRAICDRLGVAHPIQAVVWAARRGLV